MGTVVGTFFTGRLFEIRKVKGLKLIASSKHKLVCKSKVGHGIITYSSIDSMFDQY